MNAVKCYYCQHDTEYLGEQNNEHLYYCHECAHEFCIPLKEEYAGEYQELYTEGLVSSPQEYAAYCKERADFRLMIYGENPYE